MSSNELDIIKLFSASASPEGGVVGIGDDCAVLPLSDKMSLVVTTDTMTEGSHFVFDKITAEQLAYKVIASNISDVISMGAKPKYLFLAITYTESCLGEWIERFSAEFAKICSKFNILLLGGDTTKSSKALTITITAMGECETENLKFRSLAKQGDAICVLQPLGGSGAGLKLLLGGVYHPVVEYHYRPYMFVQQAIWLAKQQGVGAMMDISDGIAKDLCHIMELSGVGAEIALDMVPINPDVLELQGEYGWDAFSLALEAGEEYAPLFTVAKGELEELQKRYFALFGTPIYRIGTITSNSNTPIVWCKGGEEVEGAGFAGFTH